MDRLGHVSEKTNLIYSHVGDVAQLAASTAIERCLEAPQKQLEEKRNGGLPAPSRLLTVTQIVTQKEVADVST